MQRHASQIVLGSRSPRRLELLRLVFPAAQIRVLPPQTSHEPDFDGLHEWPLIERRLLEIARAKRDDVVKRLCERGSAIQESGRAGGTPSGSSGAISSARIVVAADTIIVATGNSGELHVLPQPPDDSTYAETVRRWFREFYAGATHTAATALCVWAGENRSVERVVKSLVTVGRDVEPWLDWYIATGEPRGKAGGYALQGAGSLFVSRVEGSLSNVVGLPLRELLEAVDVLGIDTDRSGPRLE